MGETRVDLQHLLEDLADDFPLLRSLVDRRAGGQKRLPMPGRGAEQVAAPLFAALPVGEDIPIDEQSAATAEGEARGSGDGVSVRPSPPSSDRAATPPESLPDEAAREPLADTTEQVSISATSGDTVRGRRRPARYGLLVQFESRPDDPELGRLVENTIWINDAHPAYLRAVTSRAVGYHTALAVALALAPLTVEAGHEHAFLTEFLAQWGATRADGRQADRSSPRKKIGVSSR